MAGMPSLSVGDALQLLLGGTSILQRSQAKAREHAGSPGEQTGRSDDGGSPAAVQGSAPGENGNRQSGSRSDSSTRPPPLLRVPTAKRTQIREALLGEARRRRLVEGALGTGDDEAVKRKKRGQGGGDGEGGVAGSSPDATRRAKARIGWSDLVALSREVLVERARIEEEREKKLRERQLHQLSVESSGERGQGGDGAVAQAQDG